MSLVFVYGTLKRGGSAYEHYLCRQRFVGSAISTRKFWMLSTGGFPVVLEGEEAPIRGEIYDVTDETLEALDGYEGNGSMYVRKYHEFQCDNGEKVAAQIYIGLEDFWKSRAGHLAPVSFNAGHYDW